jgi:hypothetical protein
LARSPALGAQRSTAVEEFLTLEDAAALVGKTSSNISYLVQYNRLRRYNVRGEVVTRAPNGGLRVSKSELLGYVESWNQRVRSRMDALKIGDTSLAFLDVPERERTRHVHRLHPYLGKFIPQLVGYFLSRYFEPGQVVLDPFSGCYDEQTEFLTRRGWIYGRDLNPDDMMGSLESGELRFVKPSKLYKYHYHGNMFKFSGKHLDLLVTPNHRMIVIDRYTKKVKEKMPSQVLTGDEVMRSADWSGIPFEFHLPEQDIVVPAHMKAGHRVESYVKYVQPVVNIPLKDWVAFLGLYLAEGSLEKASGRTVEISQIIKIVEVKNVLDKLPFHYGYAGHKFRLYSKQLFDYLRPLGSKYSKYIPEQVKNLPTEFLRVLLANLVLGDGRTQGDRFNYWTVSRRLADDVAEVAFKCGYGVQIGRQKPRGGYIRGRKVQGIAEGYVVYGSLHHRTPKINKKPIEVDYEGFVYCCEVPSHILLVRRNGKIVWCGNSGTTLVEASERGIDSVGIEISEFNVIISNVKLAEYDIPGMERDVLDVSKRTAEFSAKEFPDKKAQKLRRAAREGDGYLETWFAPRSLREMLYFRSLIPEYEHQDLLRVLLSRTARSCRLVHHYDLATPKEPVGGPYVCYKHMGKTCQPVTTIVPRLRFYSVDTVRRIKEFQRVRKPAASLVIEGDSRTIKLDDHTGTTGRLRGKRVDGIFTSPPYVGQIDYHEQHRYAYELFGMERRDALEIGPKARGKGEKARSEYARSMAKSLRSARAILSPRAAVLVVANDRLGLYPGIFEAAGMRVEKSFQRPVEDRTERDKQPYSETVFLARLED